MTTYTNSFHDPRNPCSKAIINIDTKPTKYKEHLIYHRVRGWGSYKDGCHVFDIVKDGVCIGMYAGPNGAKAFIDSLERKEVTNVRFT